MATTPKVYLAGKVKQGGFRDALTKNPRSMSELGKEYKTEEGHSWRYWGPLALSCDHGCIHNGLHGQMSFYPCAENALFYTAGDDVPLMDLQFYDGGSGHGDHTVSAFPDHNLPLAIVSRCLGQIKDSDIVYAWIDSLDCYATYMEIGYALAHRKHVTVHVDEKLQEVLETEIFGSQGLIERDISDRSYMNAGSRTARKNELWFMMSCCDIDAEFRRAPDIGAVVESWRKTQVKLRELEIKRRDRLKG